MERTETELGRRLITCIAVALAGLASTVEAAVLVSNIGEPRRDHSIIQENPSVDVPLPWASQSFVTDSNNYVLDSIDTLLGNLTGDPTIVAALHADTDGTAPGTLITTLSFSGIATGAPVPTTLTPTGAVNLTANTIYWIVLGALDEGSYGWEYAQGNNQSGAGGLGNYAYSDDQGATWTNFGADNPYKVTVNGTAAVVPLPGMAILFGACLAGVFAQRRISGTSAEAR